MKQLTLFDDDRRRSVAEQLRSIRYVFLTLLATGQEADAGEGQRIESYPPEIRNAIGPMIATLRREGLITIAGAHYASRPTRRRTVSRLWRAENLERCKRQAEADAAWLSERQNVAGESGATDAPAANPTNSHSNGEKDSGQAV